METNKYVINKNCDGCPKNIKILKYGLTHIKKDHDKIEDTFQKTVNHNFEARYLYGNRNKGICLCHWNKGTGFLMNKMEEIEHLVETERPHILGISEATFKSTQNEEAIKIINYNVFHSSTIDNPLLKTSRISVYVHKDINVKLRKDLMNDTFSSIWLEVGHPKQKKILVCNLYREWQYLYQANDSNSQSLEEQSKRWELSKRQIGLLCPNMG